MGYKLYDRTKETTTTTGTSTVTLGGAPTGFRTFSSVLAVGDSVDYCIELGSEWEIGTGVLASSTTLTRDLVHVSSNSSNLVSFSAGTKNVFITVIAERVVDNGLSSAIANGVINL
jgi:hypothetical protein